MGRMLYTTPLLLQQQQHQSGLAQLSAPPLCLEDCVLEATAASGGGSDGTGALPAAAAAAWAARAASTVATAAADCAAASSFTLAKLRPLLEAHSGLWDEAATAAVGGGASSSGGASASSRKRALGATVPLHSAAAGAPRLAAALPPPSPPLIAALLQRYLAELSAAAAPQPVPGTPLQAAGFLAALGSAVRAGHVSQPHAAPLLKALLALACLTPPHPCAASATPALMLVAQLLRAARDLPESALVSTFSALLRDVPSRALGGAWRLLAEQLQQPVRGSSSSHAVSALLYLGGLLVSAPRNDVFMEEALRAMPLVHTKALLAVLLRLLRMHAEHTLPLPPPLSHAAGEDTGGSGSSGAILPAPSLIFPTMAATLDWLRMVLDAHFSTLVLQCRVQAQRRAARGAPAAPPHSLLGLLEAAADVLQAAADFSLSASDFKGQLEHVLNRLPLPQPPEPEYSVEVLRV